MATHPKLASEQGEVAWRDFAPGAWQSRLNVRAFIQGNYTPYEGDGAFLQAATERTRGLWQALQPLLATEREKGILDVSQVPSDILARPGYIARIELIVGHARRPLKRPSCRSAAGVVATSLEACSHKPDNGRGRDLHEVPQDPQ
jgi:formate C-acetyltransferase